MLFQQFFNQDDEAELCKRSKLIGLCKTTGLRIVNGRHSQDPNGNITFYKSPGTILNDYISADCCLF